MVTTGIVIQINMHSFPTCWAYQTGLVYIKTEFSKPFSALGNIVNFSFHMATVKLRETFCAKLLPSKVSLYTLMHH